MFRAILIYDFVTALFAPVRAKLKIESMRRLILFLCVFVSLSGLSCGGENSASMQNQAVLAEKPFSTNSPAAENTSEIPNDLVQKLIADINADEKKFRLSKEDLEVLHNHLKHELHDLNNDGVSEFFLHIDHSDWCGAGGNCSYWIYQRTKAGYELLLEDKVLRAKDSATNGYRDLASETPMGFCDKNIARLAVTPYKYDGEKYAAQKSVVECRTIKPKQN